MCGLDLSTAGLQAVILSRAASACTGSVVQSKAIKLSKPIADVAPADLPSEGAQCFAAASIGPLAIALGDVVELEDDDEDADEPLLGLVQCIWQEEGAAAAKADLQVRTRNLAYAAVPCALSTRRWRRQGHRGAAELVLVRQRSAHVFALVFDRQQCYKHAHYQSGMHKHHEQCDCKRRTPQLYQTCHLTLRSNRFAGARDGAGAMRRCSAMRQARTRSSWPTSNSSAPWPPCSASARRSTSRCEAGWFTSSSSECCMVTCAGL